MMSGFPGRNRPFTGTHMLIVVFLFFGTIIAVNTVMATAAISTFPGLNAHNGYVASQTYNLLLDDAAAQERQGWQAELRSDASGQLHLSLRDRSGELVRGLIVTALAGRPASAAEDRELTFAPTPAGFQSAEQLPPGNWLLEIEARDGGRLAWRETRKLIVQHGGRAS